LTLFAQSRTRNSQALLLQAGELLVQAAERTNFEICSVLSGFIAERKTSPALGDAVSQAYERLTQALAVRLKQDGFSTKAANDRAQLVVALLEGGSLLAQAYQSAAPFRLAVKQAAALCSAD
jgi:TetR/AcrR family transcriptional regulator, lmrAB and yxaGH operons repressor